VEQQHQQHQPDFSMPIDEPSQHNDIPHNNQLDTTNPTRDHLEGIVAHLVDELRQHQSSNHQDQQQQYNQE
jgi:hypothetical protein